MLTPDTDVQVIECTITTGGVAMAKYLIRASYTQEGVKGLLKEGGSARREAVAQAIEAGGGSLEAFYYAFGDTDVYYIADYPDNVSAAAAALVGNSAGTSTTQTVVLITPEDVDRAVELANEKMAAYRPPGG
jgi:uncharacterized protein with GYD domain